MNILISSAGRRTSLVRAFTEAAHNLGGQVFTSDIDGLAPAHFEADGACRVPRVDTGRQFIEALLGHARQLGIGLVIPTIDTELPALAEHIDEFAEIGCQVAVSHPRVIAATADKLETQQFAAAAGVAYPATWLPSELPDDLPDRLVLKPRWGSASIGVEFCTSSEVRRKRDLSGETIIQEFIDGPEITVDALLDFDGKPLHAVPRLRLRTLAGESIQGVTLPPADLEEWLSAILVFVGRAGGRGPITLQAIMGKNGPVLIEINPRFGGGVPLTFAAGGTYPKWLLQLVRGERVETAMFDYEIGLFMTRSHSEIFTRKPKW